MTPGDLAPLRITHVSETVSTVQGHGVHTAFCDLAAAHAALGFDVGINEDRRDGVLHVHTLGPASLRRLGRHRGLRVVSAHVTPGSLEGSLVGVRLYGAAFTAYLRAFYNQAHLVLAVSAEAAAELRGIGVRTAIEVVPNAVDAEPFRSSPAARTAARAVLGLDRDDVVVLGVGQVQPRKGVQEFAECARAMPDATFVWVGGTLFGAASAGRAEMGRVVADAPANLRFTGQLARAEVARYCRAADVFLFPSRHETFGMAPVEAGFAGLPLVLSDLPVFAEVFGAQPGAYLPAGDVAGYVEHLRALRDDPGLRLRAGARAAAAVARYEGSRVAEQIADLYRIWSGLGVLGTGTAPTAQVR